MEACRRGHVCASKFVPPSIIEGGPSRRKPCADRHCRVFALISGGGDGLHCLSPPLGKRVLNRGGGDGCPSGPSYTGAAMPHIQSLLSGGHLRAKRGPFPSHKHRLLHAPNPFGDANANGTFQTTKRHASVVRSISKHRAMGLLLLVTGGEGVGLPNSAVK